MSFAMDMGGGQEPQGNYGGQSSGYGQQPPIQQPGGFQGYNPEAFGNVGAAMATQFIGGDGNMGGAVAGMAAQFGQQHYDKAREEVSKYVDVQRIKYYFTVDSACIRKKLVLLLFPFLPSIQWERVSKDGKTLPPKDDFVAPDLYIPLMAFLTYVLTIGLALGTSGLFTPEQLGIMLSSQLAWTMFEVFVCYAGLWLLNVPSSPVLELIAFCSYKFVGMVLSLLTYIMTANSSLSIAVLLWNAVATGTVLVQTLRHNSGGGKKVLYFSLGLATVQLMMMMWNFSSILSKMGQEDDAPKKTETE